MGLEDEIRKIAGQDQSDAAFISIAGYAAAFYKKLLADGVPREPATAMSVALIQGLFGAAGEKGN